MAKNVKRRLPLGKLRTSRWWVQLVARIALYIMLIALSFVFVYPILHMAVTSLKSLTDLLDPSVQWLPHELTIENYTKALDVMGFADHLGDTLLVTLTPSLVQVFSCALAGYAFARFRFRGRNLLLGCVLLTFIVPFPAIMVPTYTMYSDYGILGSIWTMILPALTGQGLRAAIFILIYRATYEQIPHSLDEAARVDGASEARVFFTIGVPLGMPAMITTFLFSFVWYWNETYMTSLFKMCIRDRYTTNAIESLNSGFRLNRGRTVFPNAMGLTKALYLATWELTNKCTLPVRNWGQVYACLLYTSRCV